MSPFKARLVAVRRGSAALDAELVGWCQRTLDDELWHRHQSQLRRLSADIAALVNAASASLDRAAEDDAGWRILAKAERGLLAANRIWDYFRTKYALRLLPDLGLMLRFADDFVWACYRPIQQAFAIDAPREPPLVHFSEVWSPYAMARDRSFANELRFAESATAESLLDEEFERILSRLPVPLVSMPWFQAGHVPSLGILAHECGHIVSWDFGLGRNLSEVIAAAQWERGEAIWQAWREELFADLFGVIVAGDGFVAALIELLACEPAQIASETVRSGPYPPRTLRIEIALTALERRDGASAMVLRQRWETAYPSRSDFSGYAADAARLIELVYGLPCGASDLASLFALDTDSINYLRDRAANGAKLGLPGFDAIGAVVLATRIDSGQIVGFPDPARGLATIAHWVDQRKTGYRSSKGEGKSPMVAIPIGKDPRLLDGGTVGAAIWAEL